MQASASPSPLRRALGTLYSIRPTTRGPRSREAALASGYIGDKDFDRIVNPVAMVGQ